MYKMMRLTVAILLSTWSASAFVLPSSKATCSTTRLHAEEKRPRTQPQKKKTFTIADLRKEMLKDPKAFQGQNVGNKKNINKVKRTRRRSEAPQQSYMYAAQRQKMQEEGEGQPNEGSEEKTEDGTSTTSTKSEEDLSLAAQARQLGLTNAASQHCESLVDAAEPVVVGQIRVGDESGSGAYAYLIEKPAGWSILGGAGGAKKKQQQATEASSTAKTRSNKKRVKIKSSTGSDEILEFNEQDVLALLTPEERVEFEAQGGLNFNPSGQAYDDTNEMPGWNDVARMTPEEREEAGIEDEDFDPTDSPDFDEAAVLALMTPEEIEEYQQEKQVEKQGNKPGEGSQNSVQKYLELPREELDPTVQENLKRIEARMAKQKLKASFSPYIRPSVVSWLKDLKAAEGTPIRGGKYWTAVAGAIGVDDSGLVLLCPKTNVENVFVDYAEYVTVVGNGQFLAPKAKKESNKIPEESVEIEIVSKVRKGREGDTCQTVRITIAEHMSTCSSIVPHVQAQFADGIRGDPAANPFDRRAPRRLIHCNSLSASSLLFDENVQAETESLPDDVAILSDRLNNHQYTEGSFLGRASLSENTLTNAYREINGASDGFQGWTVDRYGEYLFVQHDDKEYRGPLPSIHDGKTAGVYYLPANPDRGAMGSDSKIRPVLMEGRPAPEVVPVLENGVTYHVSMDRDLSTGMFLDQRLHRAWLTRNCNEDTHVLNCFAHCGAFSIAAATAGASTVSLDLNKKWLDRVQPQLEANGLEFDERHDCIYGDCFQWLDKLAKRGEKYDIVILDPPSSSVGKKKKRWSVKNDMDELVALAAPLVKKGGILWTTTNSAGMSPIKFARMCKRGLDSAGLQSAKLERIQPMPVDFPSIGPQPVKNLVWRIP